MNPLYFLEGVDPKCGRRGVVMQVRMRSDANLSHSLRLKAVDCSNVRVRIGSFAFLPLWYSIWNITRALMGRQLS